MSDWWYGKGGRQFGPFDEAALLEHFKRGDLGRKDLVWTKGMADWRPFEIAFAAELEKFQEQPPAAAGTSFPPMPPTRPDYGDILCWSIGIFPVLTLFSVLPILSCFSVFLSFAVPIGMTVLMLMELTAVQEDVRRGELKPSTYSNLHPVLMFFLLMCCCMFPYPLLQYWRNESRYFKPQPHAVWFSIAMIVLNIVMGIAIVLVAASFGLFSTFWEQIQSGRY